VNKEQKVFHMESAFRITKLSWKICVIGDEGTGKTSLIRRFVSQKYDTDYIPTIGMNISVYVTKIQLKNHVIDARYSIWDLAGQRTFQAMYQQFFPGTHGVLVLFDLTRVASFLHITNWIKETDKHQIPHKKIIIVGNKCDLTDKIAVDIQKIRELQIELQIPFYFETSACSGWNIREVFESLGKQISQSEF
jgi:Ras-related protein Rab-1A